MHETLRRRILRRLEALPEAKLYQALDYIEFLESQYARPVSTDEVSGLQRLAERLEDGLRKRTVSPSSLREAFQLIAAADRVLSSVTEAGKEILAELQGGESPRTELRQSGLPAPDTKTARALPPTETPAKST
jgi:hypothetical protein